MGKITQQEHYHDVHLLAAPARAVESLLATIAILVLVVGCGVGYPIYLLCSGQHVTAVSVVISALTILALVTFCYCPVYFMVGGFICFCLIAHFGDTNVEYVDGLLSGWRLAWMVFGFLVFGILQKYVRNRINSQAQETTTIYSDESRSTRSAAAVRPSYVTDDMLRKQIVSRMGPLQHQTNCTLHGDDPLKWPHNPYNSDND